MSKKYKYRRSMKWKDTVYKNDPIVYECSMITQLYQTGEIYVAIYVGTNPIPEQSSMEPPGMARAQKKHITHMDKKGIEYALGSEITVHKVNGFWEEVVDAQEEKTTN